MAEASNTVSTSSYTAYTNYCFHRLPCGYCMMMDRPCPMVGNVTYQTTGTYPGYDPDWWKKVTCNDAPKVTYSNTTTTMEDKNG